MALSKELNTRLTQVGPGTPGGEMLRRYWQVVCPQSELTAERPKKRIRMLGEDLVLFRTGAGAYGLIPERCPHRHVSLYHGFVEDDGLRCAYHGWKFGSSGACLEMPFEPADTKLKAVAQQPAYPVREFGGLLFAYLGPAPVPELPRWETLARTDGVRSIEVLPIHNCNWVQIQENSHDPVHTYYLHGRMLQEQGVEDRYRAEVAYFLRPIDDYEFALERTPAWTGIRKIRTYGGDRPERESGHPAIFPNLLVVPTGKAITIQFRVPIDDQHTYHIHYRFTPTVDGSDAGQADDTIPVVYFPHPKRPDGEYDLKQFSYQDQMAWETQGPIFDRSSEILGASDAGITMFRKLLREQIDVVAEGREPDGVIRDPELAAFIRFDIQSGLNRLAREMEARPN